MAQAEHTFSLNTEATQRSLWLGDLSQWMDEAFLFNLFVGTGQLVSVKLIRNRTTGVSEGYAFLEFRTHEVSGLEGCDVSPRLCAQCVPQDCGSRLCVAHSLGCCWARRLPTQS